jgi:hypothetical protein
MGLPHCPHCSSVLARGIQEHFAHPAQQNINNTKQWHGWLKIQINDNTIRDIESLAEVKVSIHVRVWLASPARGA